MRQLVGRLKFVERQRPAELLGALLAERIRAQRWAGELDAVVPVPMHWLRRAQRPCDHARLLAEAVARWLRLPVKVAVRRIRYAPSQANLPSRQRRFESVLGCFAPARFADVRGLTVCIIDNLVVSGATVCEVSKALRRAGAANIYVAVAARSAMPNERQPAAGQVLAPGSCANAAPRPVLDP
jgi:predicted amidophosphoribosyltransferase